MSSSNYVFDRHRCSPVPATTRGTCRGRGCRRHPTLGNSTTAGPIAFKFCVFREQLAIAFAQVRGGVHLHVRTCTPLFQYLANGRADCVPTWCDAGDPLYERLTQVKCRVHLHVRTCTPLSHDGASSPARPSPIKAPYWSIGLVVVVGGGRVGPNWSASCLLGG